MGALSLSLFSPSLSLYYLSLLSLSLSLYYLSLLLLARSLLAGIKATNYYYRISGISAYSA